MNFKLCKKSQITQGVYLPLQKMVKTPIGAFGSMSQQHVRLQKSKRKPTNKTAHLCDSIQYKQTRLSTGVLAFPY